MWTTPSAWIQGGTAEKFRERQLKWKDKYHNHPPLNIQVEMENEGVDWSTKNWNTMTVSDSFGSRRATAKKDNWKSHDGTTLTDAVQENWPTPDMMMAHRAGVEIDPENWAKQQAAKAMQGINKQFHLNVAVNWPTPGVADTEGAPHKLNEDGERISEKGVKWGVKLQDLVNWATPNTLDHLPPRSEEGTRRMATGPRKGRTRPSNLREQVDPVSNEIYEKENWPTPQARDWKGADGRSRKRNVNNDLPAQTENLHLDPVKPNNLGSSQEPSEKPRKLSPLWVAQLMGLPMVTWCVPVELIRSDSLEMG